MLQMFLVRRRCAGESVSKRIVLRTLVSRAVFGEASNFLVFFVFKPPLQRRTSESVFAVQQGTSRFQFPIAGGRVH